MGVEKFSIPLRLRIPRVQRHSAVVVASRRARLPFGREEVAEVELTRLALGIERESPAVNHLGLADLPLRPQVDGVVVEKMSEQPLGRQPAQQGLGARVLRGRLLLAQAAGIGPLASRLEGYTYQGPASWSGCAWDLLV
jgi:hypothetical protein